MQGGPDENLNMQGLLHNLGQIIVDENPPRYVAEETERLLYENLEEDMLDSIVDIENTDDGGINSVIRISRPTPMDIKGTLKYRDAGTGRETKFYIHIKLDDDGQYAGVMKQKPQALIFIKKFISLPLNAPIESANRLVFNVLSLARELRGQTVATIVTFDITKVAKLYTMNAIRTTARPLKFKFSFNEKKKRNKHGMYIKNGMYVPINYVMEALDPVRYATLTLPAVFEDSDGGGKKNYTNRKYTMKTRKNKKSKKRWSLKYKKSINCKRPRGFSQRQYCKYGRKKN
jgi:hypothetical protein